MRIIISHAKKIAVLLLVLFVVALSYIPTLSLDASSDSLILENDKDVLFFKSLREHYPSSENLIIAYKADNHILENTTLQHIAKLVSQIKDIKEVKSITSVLNVPLFLSPKLGLTELGNKHITIQNGNADIALAKKEFATSPIYSNNLVSIDGKTTAIITSIDSVNKDNAIASIRAVIRNNTDNATIYLGGIPIIVHDIIEYIGNDLLFFSISVIAVMALVLLMIFRSIRFVMLPLGISLFVALITTAIVAMLGWKISVISSNFFSLLLVLTLAIIIHLIVKYKELSHTILDRETLLKETITHMTKPCIYTTLTTLIAFVSLTVSDIRPVIDFGYIMAIGVSLSFVLGFVLFIISMCILPLQKSVLRVREFTITKIFAILTDKYGIGVIIASVLFALLTAYGVSKVSVENRFIDYFTQHTEIHKGLSLIDDELGGTIDIEIIFQDIGTDYFYDEFIREDIANVHQYLENKPELGKVLSIDTFLQILTTANNAPLSNFFLNIAKSNLSEEAKTVIYSPYINEDLEELRIVARVKENYPNLNRSELIKTISEDITQFNFNQDSFRVSGTLVLYNNLLASLFDSQIKTIGLVFLLIWLMFIAVFRSIRIASIALIPNIFPAVGIIGIMGILGISLDLMTITIASIAIGIGVDNAIHYITRYQQELKAGHTPIESMYRSHASIGVSLFYTALTVIIGFLILTFSNFVPSIYFGIFTSIAMLSAIVFNLSLLPKLLIMFVKKSYT